MRIQRFLADIVIAVLALLSAVYAAPNPQAEATSTPEKEQITVLYDAFGKTTAMKKDWGFAALVEIGGQRILFDTGNNPDFSRRTSKQPGVDLGSSIS